MFDKLAHNSYILCKERVSQFPNSVQIENYNFQYGNAEEIAIAQKDNKKIIIFGNFVDSHDTNLTKDDIASALLQTANLEKLLEKSKSIAGFFIIISSSEEGLFVIPDATAMIQAAYKISGSGLYVSSNPVIIADLLNLKESPRSKKIKSAAAQTHPLPYDLTMYDEIKCVIPNNYLDCKQRVPKRYYPLYRQECISVEEAVNKSCRLLKNIAAACHRKYKLSIPLTSGIDSRTVLAVCREFVDDIPLYTFAHKHFKESTPDLFVPKSISEKLNLNYHVFKTLELPNEILELYKNKFGGSRNDLQAANAYTLRQSDLADRFYLSGAIMEMAKSDIGKNLPEALARPSYLVTKTHNYSQENKREVKRWIKDIKPFSDSSAISKFDLFFWEHRCGKWATISQLNSSQLVKSLNLFNCRELLEMWLRVPRKERMDYQLHMGIIKTNWPELLDFPINPGSDYISKFFTSNSILFFVGSYIKYILHRNKF